MYLAQNDLLRIKKFATSPNAFVQAPPSKAFTLRALFISSLAQGRSVLRNALHADDQKHAANALSSLGAGIAFDGKDFTVMGNGGNPAAPKEKIFVGNSGVAARFLASYCALAKGKSVVDGDERMRQRPIEPLLQALRNLGATAKSLNKGCPPFEVFGKRLVGGKVRVNAEESSQYISSILVSAPYAENDVEIICGGKIGSEPYIDMTMECMKDFGVEAKKTAEGYIVAAGQSYKARDYSIEGDYSSASYFFAAAAVTGGKVRVKNLKKNSLQPDSVFPRLLERMGCKVEYGKDFVSVEGRDLKGISVDLNDSPDIVPTLAIVAALAKGETRIKGVAHLRIKESDRIKSVCTELGKLGVKAIELSDGMVIEGTKPERMREAEIETYNDHRIAMAFSVLGLATGKVVVGNPSCVNKSFPDFYKVLSSIK